MKNNLEIKSLMIIVIMVIILTITTISNATGANYSVGMSLTSDSKLKEGDIVTVNVNLTSINAGDGIDTIEADVSYDTNVFEALTEDDFQTNNNWRSSYAETTKRITFQKNTKVTSAGTVATIKLKVKASISVDSATVKLSNIIVSGGRFTDSGTGDIIVDNAGVTIKKEQKSSSFTEEVKKPTTTTSNTQKQNTVKDGTTTKTKKLPKAGVEQYGVIAIVVISIIGIFSYVVYKKIAKYVK